MAYRIEVLCKLYSIGLGDHEAWRPAKPVGKDAKPYEWATEREAEAARDLFYDAAKWTTRVVPVSKEG
jgi:hypothetical protein